MTQKDLADKLDKTHVTVGDYERGRATPPLSIILELCEIFDVDLQTIVFHDMETKGFDPALSPSTSPKEAHLQEQHIKLLTEHLNLLKREIREHAPELARSLKLMDNNE